MKKYAGLIIALFSFVSALAQPGPVYDTLSRIEEVFFRISQVSRISEDSAYVTIDFGKQDGIFPGSTGNVMSAHGVKADPPRESTVYVGNAKVIRLGDRSAVAAVRMYNKHKQEKIYPLDLLALEVHPVVHTVPGLFLELAKLDVHFQDNNRDDIKSKREILTNTDPGFETKLLEAYTREITEFSKELDTYGDETFTTAYKTGPYTGKTMKEVFREATVHDLRAFFHFVKTFPGKYMGGVEGKYWKINETFATWVLNNAPPGTRNRDWILPYIESASESELNTVLKKTAWFIKNDTLIQWSERLTELQGAGKLNEALSLADKLVRVARQLNDKDAEYDFYYNRSFIAEAAGRSAEALADMQKAVQYKPGDINYKYALANQYGKMEIFDKCFALYEEMKKELPGNINILGNYGWYKLTAGQVDEAIPMCRAAYYGDPSSVAFTVNYGHTFMLKGNLDSATYYYQRTLDNLYRPSDYTDGPKADFVLFFKKGFERKHTAEMADWMDRQFTEKYYPLTQGNVVWDEAKAFYNKKQYEPAAKKWKEYIALFDGVKDPPHSSLHNAHNWIGSSYWSAGLHDSAALYYARSLAIAKEQLVQQRSASTTKDNDLLTNDYERLYNFYTDRKEFKKAEEYKLLHDAEAQKVTELYSDPALHVIALGANAQSGYKGKENAARFHQAFSALRADPGKRAYTKLLQGEQLTREKLVTVMEEARKQSKPEDIFIFYYAGESTGDGQQSWINFNPKDSLQGRIAVSELLDNLDLVYAGKKMVISDLPNPGLLSLITSRYIQAGNSSSEIIFLSPGVETPVREKGVSLFTAQLTETAASLQQSGSFSAKDFTDKASYAIGRGQHYLPVLSFAYGKDFLLFEKKSDTDSASMATRGLIVKEKAGTDADVAVTGPQKNYALLFATDLYQDNGFNKLVNPINDARALQKILQQDFGFDVQLVTNPTRDEMEKWLSEYRDNKRYGPNDQLLIFFAGHGVYYDKAKMGYLVAKDSKTEDPTHKTYLSYSDLGNIYLKNINCNRIFLVLDACFAGSFFDNQGVRGNPKEIDARNLAYLKRTSANQRFYKGISSGGKQYVADGKPGQHSPFAGSFMQILYNKALQKNFVTADEIIGEIKSNPPAATAICEGNFHYSDPLSHFIFELKNMEKVSDIKTANLK